MTRFLSSLAAVVRDVRYPPALYLEFTARQTPVRTHQSVSVRPVVGGTVPRRTITK